jgi:YVTN family beta-propeller protein
VPQTPRRPNSAGRGGTGRAAPRFLASVILVASLVLLATFVMGLGGLKVPDRPTSTGLSPPTPPIDWSRLSSAASHPSGGGVGTVIETLDLVTNQLLPGNQAPAVLSSAQMVLYDSANGNLYLRAADGASIGVVNASTDTVLTSLTVGDAGSAYVPNVPTMALDTTTGDLYEVNPTAETIGVVSTATDRVTAEIHVGASPGGIVFDPANGNLYTSNWANDNVSVVSGSTGTLVKSIAVGGEPGAILYDANDSKVYVSNFNTGNVSVISTATESVVANPVTGTSSSEPLALALNTRNDLVNVVNSLTDNVSVINGTTFAVQTVAVGSIPSSATYVPGTDTLLVANGASNNVTVLQQPGENAVASIGIGHDAQGAAYDPVNGFVYTANYGSNNVSILDPATNSWKAAVTTTSYPETLAVDTSTGNVFVANEGTYDIDANLTVISGSSSRSTDSIRLNAYPTSLRAEPNGELVSTDYGGQGADLISTASTLRTAFAPTAPQPDDSAYDPVTGDTYIACEPSGAVTVATATGAVVTTVGLGFGSYGVAYDPEDGEVYVSNFYSGNVTLINGTTHAVDGVITTKPFDSLGAEIYDPASSSVYIADYSAHNVTVVRGNVTAGSIQVGTDPSSFAYDSGNDTIFVANYGSGNLSVINATTNRVAGQLSGYFPEYLAFDPTSNALYLATAENGQVTAYNASTYAELGSPVDINDSVRGGGIAYSATSGDIYVSNEYYGTIAVLSALNVSTYPVTFRESGLPTSTPWSVTLDGVTNGSSTASIGFVEPAGSYSYTVGIVTGFTASPSGGPVTVATSSQTIDITFTATLPHGKYFVDFGERGLPSATEWTVTLAGASLQSLTPFINFSEPNGNYSFSVGSVQGYSASPGSGPVNVSGMNRSVSIVFMAVGGPFSVSLAADPASLTLRNTTVLTSTVVGGTSPYTFVYTGLPTGCLTGNTAQLSCEPTGTGSFQVTVSVTDHEGRTAEANATVTVRAPGTGTSTNSGSTLPWNWILFGVALLVLVVLALLLLARRRRGAHVPAGSGSAPDVPPAAGPP